MPQHHGPCPIGGAHIVFDFTAAGERPEVPADLKTLAAAVSAALDSCGPCQGRHLDKIAADHWTTGYLVEVGAQLVPMVGETLGLPEGSTLAGGLTPTLKALYVLGAPDRAPMYDHLAALDDAARHAVALDALAMLTGQLTLAYGLTDPRGHR